MKVIQRFPWFVLCATVLLAPFATAQQTTDPPNMQIQRNPSNNSA